MSLPRCAGLAAAALGALACTGDLGDRAPTDFKEGNPSGAGAGAIASSGTGAGATVGVSVGATAGVGAGASVGAGGAATSGTASSAGVGGSGTSSSATASVASASSAASSGAGGSSGNCGVFPSDNWWKEDISGAAVDPMSGTYVASIGASKPVHPDFGTIYGIPYVNVDSSVAKSVVSFDYASESDPGPYPIPPNPPIENGGDAHILMVHTDECVLYELYAADYNGSWHAGSGAIWDLKTNSTRPAGWTSADAAGLPIYPGLARYDEAVVQGSINHALRFTAPATQNKYVAPASHHAGSNDPSLPPMGLRMRLKASVNTSGFTPAAAVVAAALKKYGMFLADNGSSWYISGAPEPAWDDNDLDALKTLQGSDFEAVVHGPLTP